MLVGRHAQRLCQRAIAIVEVEPVRAGAQMRSYGNLNTLMTGAGYLEEDAVLTLEQDFLVVGLAGRDHGTIKPDQLVAADFSILGALRWRICFCCHDSSFWGRITHAGALRCLTYYNCRHNSPATPRAFLGSHFRMENRGQHTSSMAFAARMLSRALTRPRLLLLLLAVGWRFRRRAWYRRWPFLPLPPEDYIAWRLHTAFGDEASMPNADQAEVYLRWAHRAGQR